PFSAANSHRMASVRPPGSMDQRQFLAMPKIYTSPIDTRFAASIAQPGPCPQSPDFRVRLELLIVSDSPHDSNRQPASGEMATTFMSQIRETHSSAVSHSRLGKSPVSLASSIHFLPAMVLAAMQP